MPALLLETSEESWLNMTNGILGLITLVCVLVLAFGVFQTLMDKVRARARRRAHFVYDDPHAMTLPEVGLTMADGGEPTANKQDRK